MNRIEEEQLIRDLPSRYAYYVDTYQNDKVMELWADDATFDET